MHNLIKFLTLLTCIHKMDFCSSPSFVVDWDNKQFLKDGQPFRYVSGSMHYTRVPNSEWANRLDKMKAAGLDAVQTYIQWNFHSPKEGEYNFEGDRNLETFIQTAQNAGLLVIIRGLPYTDSEWEFGGLPWYLKNSDSILRSNDPIWLGFVDQWMDTLLPKLRPYLYNNGGPIIMVQFENEYGSYYINDQSYLQHLVSKCRQHLGSEVVLFTTDGDGASYLEKGALKTELATVDFGVTDNPQQNFQAQRDYQPNAPLVNSEFYTGWLDHWGEPFNKVSPSALASSLDKILALNASVNLYTFVGGTNFGYWSGSNSGSGSDDLYVTTTYDFDAPISESGDTTWKYFLVRDVIKKYFPSVEPPPVPVNSTKTQLSGVHLELKGTLLSYFDIISNSESYQKSMYPENMEKYGFDYGFVLYRAKLTQNYAENSTLQFSYNGVRDRATVLSTPESGYTPAGYLGSVDNNINGSAALNLNKPLHEGDYLSLIVENRGRVCYAQAMQNQTKGIHGNVSINNQVLTNWEVIQLKLENLGSREVDRIPSADDATKLPLVYQAEIELDLYDTFLNTTDFSRGVALINTFNLGRYWPTKGPQHTLFFPQAIRNSSNFLLTLIEFEKSAESFGIVDFLNYSVLDGPVHSFSCILSITISLL